MPYERRRMIRRSFLASGAALALAPTVARAQSLTALRVSSSPEEDAVACLYAQSSGIFRRNGLDVTTTANTSGAAISAAVAGGAFDIGKASLVGLIAAHVHGVPFTLIAPSSMYISTAPVAATIVRADSPIKTARDLSGKTVSVQSLKGFLQVATMNWIDLHGGDSNAVKYLELPPSAVSAALQSGRVDAATLANPSLAAALSGKRARVLSYPLDAIGKYFLQAAYFCTTDFAAKNADTVARFARSIAEATAYTNAHPAETVDMVAAFTSVPAKEVASMTRATCGTKLDPAQIQPVVDVAVKYKLIPAGFDAREMIDPALRG